MSEIGLRRCVGWRTLLAAIALILMASVWAESDVMTGRSQNGMNRTNPSGGRVHNLRAVSQFEEMWDGIKTCNVTFYNPERNEAPEDGRITKYLRSRGYIVNDTGMGYLRVENLNEMFHGYKVNALTLPDEWGVYGLDIEATLPQVKRLFPLVRFEKRTSDTDSELLFATLDIGSDTKPAVFLTLKSGKIKQRPPLTTLTCRIEYGN